MNTGLIIVGGLMAAVYLSSRAQAATGTPGAAPAPGAPAPAPYPGTATAPAPVPVVLPPAVQAIAAADIRAWLQANGAFDGSISYDTRVRVINAAALDYGVSRAQIAAAIGKPVDMVDRYLDGRLDYFRAG